MRARSRFWALLIIAITLGALVCWIDSRPHWDDAGITAAMVFGVAAVMGIVIPGRAWIWAFAVGVWIPLYGIVLCNNYATALALVVAFAGAYLGAFIRHLLVPRA